MAPWEAHGQRPTSTFIFMSEIVIRLDNIGKQYRIGAIQQGGGAFRYRSLRDSLTNGAAAPFRALRSLSRSPKSVRAPVHDTFWALKNIFFEVGRGQVVGVIGRNGAGKSTLLKILSRITEPTSGRAEIRGHVGSLLEVGTGFH